MVSWPKIARPFIGHFLFNLFKTILGSALVGYGIAQLQPKHERIQDDPDPALSRDPVKKQEPNTPSSASSSSPSPYPAFLERYVTSCVMIGVGLYFSLPSLASQMLWEAAIPAITATELVQGLATDSVFGFVKSWKPETKNWPRPTLGSVSGGSKSAITAKNFAPSSDGNA
jgi:hypothetical protein